MSFLLSTSTLLRSRRMNPMSSSSVVFSMRSLCCLVSAALAASLAVREADTRSFSRCTRCRSSSSITTTLASSLVSSSLTYTRLMRSNASSRSFSTRVMATRTSSTRRVITACLEYTCSRMRVCSFCNDAMRSRSLACWPRERSTSSIFSRIAVSFSAICALITLMSASLGSVFLSSSCSLWLRTFRTISSSLIFSLAWPSSISLDAMWSERSRT
mmetsp:Transcript_26442/g.64918  ORF Transcript_26442/g.64918 Transcript_26442/m.64918 type:complete len:215 (+) Transcript_26442:327-971(+)